MHLLLYCKEITTNSKSIHIEAIGEFWSFVVRISEDDSMYFAYRPSKRQGKDSEALHQTRPDNQWQRYQICT